MWDNGGLVRNKQGLNRVLKFIKQQLDNYSRYKISRLSSLPKLIEYKNLLTTSKLILESAIKRKESRGSHFRSDYPKTDKNWQKNIIIKNEQSKS